MRTPLPQEAVESIEANVPYVRSLPEEDRRELEGLVQVFLEEKWFEGAGGLELTDEIRVTVAAQACILLLRRDTDVYPELRTVVVYPRAYLARATTQDAAGIVTEGEQLRLGESWDSGTVVLSWDDVRHGAADIHDGHNVVLHEFAHQLDQEGGATDGTPVLGERSRYISWARVLGWAFEDLQERIEAARKIVLDPYAGTNAAEFFAVATECFFEKPHSLERHRPELYAELRRFYRRDPAALERGEPERLEELDQRGGRQEIPAFSGE
jgi:Mlc titration factor MtfA (ptsG expression regulator)